MHCTQAASSRIQGEKKNRPKHCMKNWTKQRERENTVDLTLIKTPAKIHSICGRPQIGQDLASGSCEPPKAYANQKYLRYLKNTFVLDTLNHAQQLLPLKKKRKRIPACDWNENAVFSAKLLLGKELETVTCNVLMQVSVPELTLDSSYIWDAFTRKN